MVAHRGASDLEPEHTLAAYRHAIEVGADALECDVRLSGDGHLVCLHDRRVDRTSDGSGLVSTLDLDHLRALDWGSWKGGGAEGEPAGAGQDPVEGEGGPAGRSGLLTLRQLLSLVAEADRPVELAIETKHPTRYGGLVERGLVEVLDEFGWAHPGPGRGSPVRVMSFSVLALRRLRMLAPRLPQVFLMRRLYPPFQDGSLPRGVMAAGISVDLLRLDPDLPTRVRRRGGQVHVWTVDDDADVRRCLDSGVAAIITNRPERVRGLVDTAWPTGPGLMGPTGPA
ncbi:MAG: glycerophosphodiester phosphodiesterase family protein [Kineosporiaceae bacterium]